MIVRIDGKRQPRPIDGRIDHLDCPAGAVERGQAQASVVRRVCNPREIVLRVECVRCECVAPLVNGFDIPSGSIEGGVPHVEVSVVIGALDVTDMRIPFVVQRERAESSRAALDLGKLPTIRVKSAVNSAVETDVECAVCIVCSGGKETVSRFAEGPDSDTHGEPVQMGYEDRPGGMRGSYPVCVRAVREIAHIEPPVRAGPIHAQIYSVPFADCCTRLGMADVDIRESSVDQVRAAWVGWWIGGDQ